MKMKSILILLASIMATSTSSALARPPIGIEISNHFGFYANTTHTPSHSYTDDMSNDWKQISEYKTLNEKMVSNGFSPAMQMAVSNYYDTKANTDSFIFNRTAFAQKNNTLELENLNKHLKVISQENIQQSPYMSKDIDLLVKLNGGYLSPIITTLSTQQYRNLDTETLSAMYAFALSEINFDRANLSLNGANVVNTVKKNNVNMSLAGQLINQSKWANKNDLYMMMGLN